MPANWVDAATAAISSADNHWRILIWLSVAIALLMKTFIVIKQLRTIPSQQKRVESVNFHFNRACNYECKFCFHTDKEGPGQLTLEQQKRGLAMLAEQGMAKINFSGGEPLLHPDHVGKLITYCKDELHIESVSIVSDGSLKTLPKWFKKYGHKLDVFAVSCDSFSNATNLLTGRGERSDVNKFARLHPKHIQIGTVSADDHSELEQIATRVLSNNPGQRKIAEQVRNLCLEHDVMFKLNTVVNANNVDEDMTGEVKKLNPIRWKVFQCLRIEGENSGEGAKRNLDADELEITDDQFDSFIELHQKAPEIKRIIKPENNADMRNSYWILDEQMRFLNCKGFSKIPTDSILEIGVERAAEEAGFDATTFEKRGGRYQWAKSNTSGQALQGCSSDPSLNW